ncbi:MAG: sulfotransferase domain-containing protein [Candidatus Competibacteraceae bacterium]
MRVSHESSFSSSNFIKRPDFFIVGAPKCGTTALYEYLRQHPDIFMPELKEPHYFSSDLHPLYRTTGLDNYLALFKEAQAHQQSGEASSSYLYSKIAASAIEAFNPLARIIILLRNPVDAIYSSHSYNLFSGNEAIQDLETALELEEDRKQGRQIPESCRYIETLFYRDRYRYVSQVQRYFDLFGRSQVWVIIYDDLRNRLPQVYADTLRFLGVDAGFKPTLSVVNPNKQVRGLRLHHLVLRLSQLKAWLWLRRWIPFDVWQLYLKLNITERPRPAMPSELRRRLIAEFAPEVARLSQLIERDLGAWSQ